MSLWAHQKAAYALELRSQSGTLAVEDVPTHDSAAFASLGGSANTMDRFETTFDRQFARSLRLLRWEQQLRRRTQQVIENKPQTLNPEPDTCP